MLTSEGLEKRALGIGTFDKRIGKESNIVLQIKI